MKKIIFLLLLISFFNIPSFSQSTDSTNNEMFTIVEEPASYPGGETARLNFMSNNIKYPKEAREKGIQGTVYIGFVVEKDGSLSDIKVLRGIGGGCDEEALRIVKLMPNWIPGKQKGENVRIQFNMPIRFVLPTDTKKEEKK